MTIKRLVSILLLAASLSAFGENYSYSFRNTPLADALARIAREHPSLNLNFIYNDLEHYHVSAEIDTDNAAEAVRKAVGRNPVSVVVRRNAIYVEALQKGRYRYTGRALSESGESVPYANVMLLAPKDSAVITHGATDDKGFFSIPCDRTDMIAKLSSVGHRTTFRKCNRFSLGDIIMPLKEIELKNITVKSDSRYIDGDKSVFIPSKREKNAAHGGQALLLSMAIPTIVVNPIDNSITSNSGEGVATFIDYLPASKQDVSNLRPQDVLRVEVLDSPADPRFEGALHVVNFIMVKYEYGGYTKFDAYGRSTELNGNVNANSKFSYKDMVYDAAVGYSVYRSRHDGFASKTVYGMPEGDIVKDEATLSTLGTNHNPFATLRAVYATEKTTVSNTIGLQYRYSPDDIQDVATDFSSPAYISSRTHSNTRRRRISPSFDGTYRFLLPRSFSLVVSPNANYGHNTSDYIYDYGEGKSIVNNVKEDTYSAFLSALAQKNWGRQSLGVSVNGELKGDRIVYEGTNPSKVNSTSNAIGMRLRGNLAFGNFHFNADVKCYFSRKSYDKQHFYEWLPGYFLYGGYTFNSKNKISFSSEMSNWTTSLIQLSPSIVVRSQIDAQQGNPSLKCYRYNAFSLNYQWIPRQNLSVSAFSKFYRFDKPITELYSPQEIDGRQMMLRTFVRNGFFAETTYGVSAWLGLFDNALSLSARVDASSSSRRGMINRTQTYMSFQVQAYYYIGSFYFSAFYRYRNKSINAAAIFDSPSYYSLSAGWNHKGLNITLYASDFLRSDWKATGIRTVVPNYSSTSSEYSSSYHRCFSLQVSYSFSYGKKLRQNDELQSTHWAPSGIVD